MKFRLDIDYTAGDFAFEVFAFDDTGREVTRGFSRESPSDALSKAIAGGMTADQSKAGSALAINLLILCHEKLDRAPKGAS